MALAGEDQAPRRGAEDKVHAERIASLRRKLLDLSNRNRLLNYRHSKRSRVQLRVVDELPDVLYERLSTGKPMVFQPIPSPDPATDDHGVPIGEAQAAARCGLNLDFDLPEATAADGAPAKHVDEFIQTAHFYDEMDRRLRGIREHTRSALQEMGVHTLYAAFGFLEWREKDDSKPQYAPLLLMPLDMERALDTSRGLYVYRIHGLPDESVASNLTLEERLRRDFGLQLPALDENETPTSYFGKVSRFIDSRRSWRVRRWITVGNFQFARLVMYEDLGSELLTERLHSLPLSKQLLSATSSESTESARDYELDDPNTSLVMPRLIYDADSSQTSAIVDVLDGKHLALKGPPGTGKSQTITNLIAAAMDRGLSVLFVAEKMAALEVVHKRLEAAGLGEFCLELHSTKSKKTDVLQALERRIALQSTRGSSALSDHEGELRSLRDRLNRYATIVRSSLGRMGISVGEAIWRSIRAEGAATGLPDALNAVGWGDATEITTEWDAGTRRTIARLVAMEDRMETTIRDHPWRFVDTDLPPAGQRQLLAECRQWTAALGLLAQQAEPLNREGVPKELRVAVAERLSAAPTPPRCHREILGALGVPGGPERLTSLLESLRTIAGCNEAIEKTGATPTRFYADLASADEVASAALTQHVPTGGLAARAQVYAQLSVRLQQISKTLADLFRVLGTHEAPTGRSLAHLRRARQLLAQADPTTLELRAPPLVSETGERAASLALADLAGLQSQREALGSTFDLGALDGIDFQDAIAELRSASWWSWLRKPYRQARRTYRLLARGVTKSPNDMATDLERLRDYAQALVRIDNDPGIREVIGDRYRGLDTDVAALGSVVAWAKQVRAELAEPAGVALTLKTLLLEQSTKRVHAFVSAWDDVEGQFEGLTTIENDDRSLMELSTAAAETSQHLFRTADAAAGLGLRDSVQGAELRELVGRVRQAHHLWRSELSQGVPPPLQTNAPPLDAREHADDVAAALSYRQAATELGLGSRLTQRLLALAVDPGAIARLAAACGALLESYRAAEDLGRRCVGTGVRAEWATAALLDPAIHSRLLHDAVNNEHTLPRWCDYRSVRRTLDEGRLGEIAAILEEAQGSAADLLEAYDLVLYRSLANAAYRIFPDLRDFDGADLESTRSRFQQVDQELLRVNRREITATLLRRDIPAGNARGKAAEFTDAALIKREIGKQRRHVPIRDLLLRAGNAAQAMCPCFLMSPLSVAQFLAPESISFDLVVIDEASQMRPEDALGAAARARQAVIVGDPKQLPPTSFFQAWEADEDEEGEDTEKVEGEAILDLALGAFHPSRDLRWHYRSRHHDLIRFSNRHFYDCRLLVVPSPADSSNELGVKATFVDGAYSSSTNPLEAEAVVEAVAEFAHRWPERSLGVVAMNQKQMSLIAELIDYAARKDPRIERFRERWTGTLDEFFVKNLETVQGDERDVIFISMTYGPEQQGGQVYQRFGPINGVHGHRRLNVLFTRAKRMVRVFTSMRAADIQVADSSRPGLKALHGYLDYATTGRIESGTPSGGSTESSFEEIVKARLEASGFECIPQVGVAGFFIDLGIRHPDFPHGFLCGVECDGAAYHSSRSARDRDRLRQELLEGLGWKLFRVWSTDWFRNPATEHEKLLRDIRGHMHAQRNA